MRLHAFVLMVVPSLSVAASARAAGSITGSVKLAGKAPEPKVVDPKSDPYCVKQAAIKDEEVVAGPAGELKNVVVRITKGAAPPKTPPAANAVIEQTGCAYVPHVLVVQAGQTVEIRNSDVTFHSIHTYKGTSSLFNLPQVQGMPPYFKKFATAGDVIKLRCDIHKWMAASIVVAGNPFFAVTGADGRFTIADVPPGKYTVEIWHERLGTKTQALTVTDGKAAELAVELKVK
jgi:plastocyanin